MRDGGSSPLARGTLQLLHVAGVAGRFIPAGAGNTKLGEGDTAHWPVHPRWRGEHSGRRVKLGKIAGSSPLARGTRLVRLQRRAVKRFIPAGAGNTSRITRMSRRTSVHPRWRGEHSTFRCSTVLLIGSSPLARGTRHRSQRRALARRFIPAGAGNTFTGSAGTTNVTVHPRWRGEHNHVSGVSNSTHGSSPLARGTPGVRARFAFPGRFIPAGAGNTRRWRPQSQL